MRSDRVGEFVARGNGIINTSLASYNTLVGSWLERNRGRG